MSIDSINNTTSGIEPADFTALTSTTEASSKSDSFTEYMKKALGGETKTQVSEEELFAGLLQHGLEDISAEAASFFAEANVQAQARIRRGDGYINVEEAALQALNSTVQAGLITQSQADTINGRAFEGAQLDGNLDALYDDRGGVGDPTIAVASMEEALAKISAFQAQLDNGSFTVDSRSISSGPTGSGDVAGSSGIDDLDPSGSQSLDGSGGFLWKPVSESDGNLVVLLPEVLKGLAKSVEIHTSLPPSEATKLAEGRFAGDDKNGNRPHFRFDKEGGDYGDNVHLVAYMNDGSMQSWKIGDGGSRND